jgi:hypothetical protein
MRPDGSPQPHLDLDLGGVPLDWEGGSSRRSGDGAQGCAGGVRRWSGAVASDGGSVNIRVWGC